MPQPKKGARFGNSASHHNMMMANLTTELIRHGRIRTTFAKAKTVQPLAEKMITFGKRGDLHARRQVLRVIRDKDVVQKLFADVGPAFADRNGGYTRVLKLGARKGDAAPMALIEFTEGISSHGEGDLAEAPRRRWSLRRRQGSVSASARERSVDRAAAIDRGEDPDLVEDDYDLDEVDDSAQDTTQDVADDSRDDGADARTDDSEATPESLVEADPAEVEARLAAEEEAEGVEAESSGHATDEGTDTRNTEDDDPDDVA